MAPSSVSNHESKPSSVSLESSHRQSSSRTDQSSLENHHSSTLQTSFKATETKSNSSKPTGTKSINSDQEHRSTDSASEPVRLSSTSESSLSSWTKTTNGSTPTPTSSDPKSPLRTGSASAPTATATGLSRSKTHQSGHNHTVSSSGISTWNAAATSTSTSTSTSSSSDDGGDFDPINWLSSAVSNVEGDFAPAAGGVTSFAEGLIGHGQHPTATSSSDSATSTSNESQDGISVPFHIPFLGDGPRTSTSSDDITSSSSPPWWSLTRSTSSPGSSSMPVASSTISDDDKEEDPSSTDSSKTSKTEFAHYFTSISSYHNPTPTRTSSSSAWISSSSDVSPSISTAKSISDAEGQLSSILEFGSIILATQTSLPAGQATPTGRNDGAAGNDTDNANDGINASNDVSRSPGHHKSGSDISNSREGFAISAQHPGAIVGLTVGSISAVIVLPLLLFFFWWLPRRGRAGHRNYKSEKSAIYFTRSSAGLADFTGHGRKVSNNGGQACSDNLNRGQGATLLRKMTDAFRSLVGSRSSQRSIASRDSWGDRSLNDEGEEWGHRWANHSSGSDGRLTPEEMISEFATQPVAKPSEGTLSNKSRSPVQQSNLIDKNRGWNQHTQSREMDMSETTPLRRFSKPESVEELIDPFVDPQPNDWPKRV